MTPGVDSDSREEMVRELGSVLHPYTGGFE